MTIPFSELREAIPDRQSPSCIIFYLRELVLIYKQRHGKPSHLASGGGFGSMGTHRESVSNPIDEMCQQGKRSFNGPSDCHALRVTRIFDDLHEEKIIHQRLTLTLVDDRFRGVGVIEGSVLYCTAESYLNR